MCRSVTYILLRVFVCRPRTYARHTVVCSLTVARDLLSLVCSRTSNDRPRYMTYTCLFTDIQWQASVHDIHFVCSRTSNDRLQYMTYTSLFTCIQWQASVHDIHFSVHVHPMTGLSTLSTLVCSRAPNDRPQYLTYTCLFTEWLIFRHLSVNWISSFCLFTVVYVTYSGLLKDIECVTRFVGGRRLWL